MIIAQIGLGAASAPLPTFNPQATQIRAVQSALRALGATDENGRLPPVDGILGVATVQAYNRIRAALDSPPVTAGEILVNLPVVAQQLRDLIPPPIPRSPGLGDPQSVAAQAAATTRVQQALSGKPKPRPAPIDPLRPKIIAFQNALRNAGAVDDKGRLPIADGVIGPSTLQAFNGLQSVYGRQALTTAEIRGNLDYATQRITDKAVSDAVNPRQSRATMTQAPTVASLASKKTLVGDYVCKSGYCEGGNTVAKDKAIAFQKALNGFPPIVIAKFPGAHLLRLDGKIGRDTVNAFKIVLLATAARTAKGVDKEEMDRITPEMIVAGIEDFTVAVLKEQSEQQKIAAQIADRQPGVMPDKSSWTLTAKGNAVGNRRFKCFVMALQVQLNRYGQRLAVEGVLGPNTIASLNRVLRMTLTIAGAADSLEALVTRVREKADAEKVPPPPATAGGQAYSKCLQEISQPATDARIPEEHAHVAAAGLPTPTATSPAPQPKPTPTKRQPLPGPPVHAAPTRKIGTAPRKGRPTRAARRGGQAAPAPFTPSGGGGGGGGGGGEADTGAPDMPPDIEAPPPESGAIGPEQEAGLQEQAEAAGVDPGVAQDAAQQGQDFEQAQQEVQQQAAQKNAVETTEVPKKSFPWKVVGISLGAVSGAGLLGLGLYTIGQRKAAKSLTRR